MGAKIAMTETGGADATVGGSGVGGDDSVRYDAGAAGRGAGVDAEIVAASLLVCKGLFLRGFYLNNDLTYDAAGRVQGSPRVGDWTVAAVNVLKAERRGADEIELVECGRRFDITPTHMSFRGIR